MTHSHVHTTTHTQISICIANSQRLWVVIKILLAINIFSGGSKRATSRDAPPLGPIYLLFSCSFRQKFCQVLGWSRWVRAPSGKSGSATNFADNPKLNIILQNILHNFKATNHYFRFFGEHCENEVEESSQTGTDSPGGQDKVYMIKCNCKLYYGRPSVV